MPDTPRTDPGERDLRTGLPPRVGHGKASLEPRVKDTRVREVIRRESSHTVLRDAILLATSLERAPPEVGHVMSENTQTLNLTLVGIAW